MSTNERRFYRIEQRALDAVTKATRDAKRFVGIWIDWTKFASMSGTYGESANPMPLELRGGNGQIAIGTKKHTKSDSHRITEMRTE